MYPIYIICVYIHTVCVVWILVHRWVFAWYIVGIRDEVGVGIMVYVYTCNVVVVVTIAGFN